MKKAENFEAYAAGFPKKVQTRLKQIRKTVRQAAPDADEVISYGMPAYKFHGMLLYFAAHTHHIGFYPMASGIQTFKKELSSYKGAKGSVQFPNDEPLPLDLIEKIVTFRVEENAVKAEMKKIKPTRTKK